MRTRRCAPRNGSAAIVRKPAAAHACCILALACGLLAASPARSVETMVLNIILNREAKGEFFVVSAGDGQYLVKVDDLRAMGFRDPSGRVETIDGDRYLSLRAIPGVSFTFDERTLTLEIMAPPSLFGVRTLDLQPARQPKVLYPSDRSGFLNYSVGHTGGDAPDDSAFDATIEAGARTDNILFLTDATWSNAAAGNGFVRLMSSATLDRRATLERFVFGDSVASSGDLGATLNMGGISLSKLYRIDPYLIRYPLADMAGIASTPSEIEVYVNGVQIRKERVAPGGFELRNLSSFGGASTVTVRLRDAFGREETVRYPFYFTDVLLRKGLHEYSYNAGFLREDFGTKSNRYGSPAFSAFHRVGRSDALTVGGRAEGGGGVVNAGAEAVYLLTRGGIVSGALSAGLTDGEGGGVAARFGHSYQGDRIGTSVLLAAFTRNYALVGGNDGQERVRFQAVAGASYGLPKIGSVSVDAAVSKKYLGQDAGTASMTYSKRIRSNTSLLATARRTWEPASTGEVFIGLTYYPGADYTLSGSYRRSGAANVESVQLQKNIPAGEGYAIRAALERTDSEAVSSTTATPFVQYNAPWGAYTAEYKGLFIDGDGKSQAYRLTAAGGIAAVGGTVGFSRPITDSFGLVVIDNIAGVRVSQNNQEMGRTDAKGRLFIPNLGSYYENQVAINDRDIPIDRALPEVVKYVSPPFRSGSVIRFDAKRFQAVTGYLVHGAGDAAARLEFREATMGVDGREISFPTGRGGEFYIEDLPSGTYEARVDLGGNRCRVTLAIPRTDETIVDLGGLRCEDMR